MKHLRHLRYFLRHKRLVFVECWKRGIIWRGIVHDLSKLRPSEWFAYVNSSAAGISYDDRNTYTIESFSKAWLLHQHRNKHHWQYWHMTTDVASEITVKMPEKYALEMVCDWIGAGKAKRKESKKEFVERYAKNKHRMTLHSETRKFVEKKVYEILDHHI